MITLGNQFAIQFNLGDRTDFLDIEDFRYMRIAENAGGLRPILEMSFKVNDEDIVNYLNTGNIISMMYGVSEPVSDMKQFEIAGDSKNKEYHVGEYVDISGVMYNPAFTSQKKSNIFKNKCSYEVLKQIAVMDGLNFVSNVTKTNDRQTWYQSGIKDWTMLNYVAARAYKDTDTFFSYGFDNNNIYFYDVRELLKQGVKWTLTVRDSGNSEQSNIVNIGTYNCNGADAGTHAELAGKNVTNVGYNLDTGEFSNPKYNLKTFTTMDTNKLNINSTNCINYNYQITTSDEHAFTMEAINQNNRNNILFSSYNCYVPVAGQYRDFRLLDTVELIPAEADPQAAGFYFITAIAREYNDKQYNTILTLNRESANGIQGDNLEGGG